MMIQHTRIRQGMLLLGLSLLACGVFASGAFSPLVGGFGSEDFNKGKAIYSGRIGSQGCISCHEHFDRSRLVRLEQPISVWISNCQLHDPCYEALNEKELKALDVYFKRRYHL